MTDKPIAVKDRGRLAAAEPSPEVPAVGGRTPFSVIEMVGRFAAWPFMIALRRGLLLSLPLVLVGAFALFVATIVAFPAATELLGGGADIARSVCVAIIDATFGLVALVVVIGFSHSLAALTGSPADRYPVRPSAASVVALTCFFIIVAPDTLDQWKAALSAGRGLPAALAVSISASYLFLFLARRRLFRLTLRGSGGDPLVGDLFSILPAAAVTVAAFALIRQAQVGLGAPDLTTALSAAIAAPFAGSAPSAPFAAAYTLASQVIWFLGGHGANIMEPVLGHILTPASQAAAGGTEPVRAITSSFFPVYTAFGGTGATLCLIAALLLGDRDPSIRRLAWLSLLPALINVNEPLVFGLPLILNPIYAVPFILTPVALALLSYGATVLGFVPPADVAVSWTMPPLFSGYLATGSPAGAVVQAIGIVGGTLLYLPFVRIAARLRHAANAEALSTLLVAAEVDETAQVRRLIDLPGTAGRFANALAQDLAEALEAPDKLYLNYQPQICVDERRVFGVEALLRWNHDVYGPIPPPVTVALAEDMRMIDRLGEHVLRLACRQRADWGDAVADDLVMSVNVSPRQLQEPGFDAMVLRVLAEEGLEPRLLELELTESTSLAPALQAVEALQRLRDAGIRIALDDFGMGHTSLRYLRELPLDTLKIDRSLTFSSHGDLNEHVIRSIVALSRTLGLTPVVEGIEQPEQLPRFVDLGCARFQGYLFSRPLGGGPCLDYIRANTRAS